MTSKKIKPYAVVPKELYVVRTADRQLRQIVEDMGRPGYVLVSRQMGKTNLLLNAKRDLDSSTDCFSYVDVSNSFDDLRSFFRNIVDTTLSCKEDVFQELAGEISCSRTKTALLQPHKEHELELRSILNALPGKLIVCLDEIDALTKVDYSDNVFSLIRSIYFSGRTNFPQFKRLTYILSGVADPSELIKNKAISPFNIGEKIYLEDFTIDETKKFLCQCSLDLSDEVIDRIYYWTSGNPRVTWDVCSGLENRLGASKEVNVSDVDNEVKDIYLISYDLPPFDHIRTRVSLDKEIRNAVMVMHYGKTIPLSDKIKDRLYLAGISTPKQKDGSILFRNKIMAESVSQKWIGDIESEQFTLQERATDKLKAGFFSEAAVLFQESIIENEDDEETLGAKLNIGFCFTQLQEFDLALSMFSQCELGNKPDPSLRDFKAHWSGICFLCTQQYELAIQCFREIVYPSSEGTRSNFYYESCVNLASAISAVNDAALLPRQDNSEIESLLQTVVNAKSDISKSSSPISAINVMFTAHYQLSRYYAGTQNTEQAIRSLDAASEFANEEAKRLLDLEHAALETDPNVQSKIYANCAENFLATKSILSKDSRLTPLSFGVSECATLIVRLCGHSESELAGKLARYINSSEQPQIVNGWELLVKSTMNALTEQEFKIIPNIVKLALEFRGLTSATEYHQCLVLGLLIVNQIDSNELADRYVNDFLKLDGYVIKENDFRVVTDLVFTAAREDNSEKALTILDLAETAFERLVASASETESIVKSGALCLLHLRLCMKAKDGSMDDLRPILIEYIPEILNSTDFSLPYFPDNYGELLYTQFQSMIHPDFFAVKEAASNIPFRALQKIGRNQKVVVQFSDGRTEVGKYKKFAERVDSEECQVISVIP